MRILMVEDNAADAYLSSLALKRAQSDVDVVVVDDGIPAIAYLREKPLPAVVILDLNLGLMNGLDVLRWIRQEPKTKDVPVVIYSSSPADAQAEAAAKADRYVEKPGDLDEYMKIGSIVAEFLGRDRT